MRIGTAPGLVYYLLNKPAGVVTTAADTHGRPIVTDLVPAEPRVFPIGRLDQDTEGLLLLTNDGDLAQRLDAPEVRRREGVPRRGRRRRRPRGELRRLREGVELDDGLTAPAKVGARRAQPPAHHHPRGSQAPGASHVRRHRASRRAPGAHADRPAGRPLAVTGRVAAAHDRRGPDARTSCRRRTTPPGTL